jgi:hypothetical protein
VNEDELIVTSIQRIWFFKGEKVSEESWAFGLKESSTWKLENATRCLLVA